MKIKLILSLMLGIFLIGIVSASYLPLFPNPGISEASTNIAYEFNWTEYQNCSGVILSHNEIVAINSRGFGFVQINFSADTTNYTKIHFLCEYKDNSLRKVHNLSSQFFDKVFVKDLYVSNNVNVTGNVTAKYFIGNGSQLNVNRSNYWDNYNVSTDLNYRLLLYWANITNSPTHLSNFTDNILWTATFNASFDQRDSGDNSSWNETFATTLYVDITGDNMTGNLNITGNATGESGLFSYLGSLANRITELFVQDINFNGIINGTGNIITTGNMTADYYSGQPLDGSIGSGIINASRLTSTCGCVNASDTGGLDVLYPDTLVKIWNYGTNTYCNIAEDTYTVPDDAHTVYYVDSACAVQTMIWENYFAQSINPSNYVKLFSVFTKGGDIEVVKGGSVIGIIDRKLKWNNVNCPGGHLSVCDGMAITKGIFPEINMSAGHFKYSSTPVTIIQQDSNPNGLHVTCGSDDTHTVGTEIDMDKCDNGVTCDACPTNKYRRYIIYDIGWGVAHTKIHQLAPLDDDTFTTLANCIDTSKNPLSYTLPSTEDGVAVPLAFYCGKSGDTAWTNGLVDLRMSGSSGFGASPDLSIFVPYTEANQNVDLGVYNITANYFFGNGSQLTDISYTETDPLWSGNQSLVYLKSNPSGFWNATFALFNKTYADTIYSTIAEPLWSGNFSNVAFKDTKNIFTANQTIDAYLNITGGILLENNATISRNSTGTKMFIDEKGNMEIWLI